MATKTLLPLLTLALVALSAFGAQPAGRENFRASGMPLTVDKADQLLQRSNFVFIGTVVQTQASNLSSVASSAQTTLVRVDQVLHGTPFLADSLGQVITVQSDRAREHQRGQVSTFFLEVDTFGESLSGYERARFTQTPGADTLHAQAVADARLHGEDRDLATRIRKADQVVQGRVVLVEPAGIDEPRSEHAANWYRAVVQVASMIKGRPDTKMVTFFFPTSVDRMWKDAPRYTEGQEGAWLLHLKPNDYSRKSEMIPGLTALDLKDFQRPEQMERLQRLATNR